MTIARKNIRAEKIWGNLDVTSVSASTVFGNTLSGNTIYSGATNLYNIFQTVGSDPNKTNVQPGVNTYTGGTADAPSVNISAATFDNLTVSGTSTLGATTANSLSATTLSGSIIQSSTLINSGNVFSTILSKSL